jgi:hypothetical protein
VFDEYDAGRPDVMFVIQRVLEVEGKLTLLDQNKVIRPHPYVPPVRHRQHGGPRRHDRPLPRHAADQPGPDGPLVDRGDAELPAARAETEIVLAKNSDYRTRRGRTRSRRMVTGRPDRAAFIAGDISTVMSPRTVITWAENARIFGDVGFAFRLTFLNKCDEAGAATGGRVLPALLRRGTAGKRGVDAPRGSRPMSPAPDNPADPFKKALAEATRALAGDPDLAVSYSSDPPGWPTTRCACRRSRAA